MRNLRRKAFYWSPTVNFKDGTLSGKLGGLSCGGESIITEGGPDATEFPKWVEGVGEPGDRGMSKSAAVGGSPSSWLADASPSMGRGDGIMMGALPVTALGRRWFWCGRGGISSQLRCGSTNFTFSWITTQSFPLCCWPSHSTVPRTRMTTHCGSQRLVNANRSSALSKIVSPTWIFYHQRVSLNVAYYTYDLLMWHDVPSGELMINHPGAY